MNNKKLYKVNEEELRKLVNGETIIRRDNGEELSSYADNVIDTSEIIDMSHLFNSRKVKYSIENWNVSNVEYMSCMFIKSTFFNQDIGGWNVSNVNCMTSMFNHAYEFNQYLNWNAEKCVFCDGMFYSAYSFNNGGKPFYLLFENEVCLYMNNMFHNALSFNQPVRTFCSPKTIDYMFFNARSFDQHFCVDGSHLTKKPVEVFSNSKALNDGRYLIIDE